MVTFAATMWTASIDGDAPPTKMTTSEAWDDHPVLSPDGKTLAYVAMEIRIPVVGPE